MFEKNTRKINNVIAKMFAVCSVLVIVMAVLSILGVFEFGNTYTVIVLVAGLVVSVSPILLIRFVPPYIMKYYMLIILAVFIGILGTSNHIGIYITYALVPIFSCLYFDPKFTIKMSIISYFAMAVSVYISTASNYEVLYMGKSHIEMFIAYLLGFTFEFLIVSMILIYLVKRAKNMMEERYSAEEQNKMKSRLLSNVSHEIRTPMNAILGMADVALRDGKDLDGETRKCLEIDEAENGAESVEKASSAVYDMILMDSQMPVMNGEEATGHIRSDETSLNRTTPIVALTADAVSGVRERLLAAGMSDYLVKPITISAITGIVIEYLPQDKIIYRDSNEER